MDTFKFCLHLFHAAENFVKIRLRHAASVLVPGMRTSTFCLQKKALAKMIWFSLDNAFWYPVYTIQPVVKPVVRVE